MCTIHSTNRCSSGEGVGGTGCKHGRGSVFAGIPAGHLCAPEVIFLLPTARCHKRKLLVNLPFMSRKMQFGSSPRIYPSLSVLTSTLPPVSNFSSPPLSHSTTPDGNSSFYKFNVRITIPIQRVTVIHIHTFTQITFIYYYCYYLLVSCTPHKHVYYKLFPFFFHICTFLFLPFHKFCLCSFSFCKRKYSNLMYLSTRMILNRYTV